MKKYCQVSMLTKGIHEINEITIFLELKPNEDWQENIMSEWFTTLNRYLFQIISNTFTNDNILKECRNLNNILRHFHFPKIKTIGEILRTMML